MGSATSKGRDVGRYYTRMGVGGWVLGVGCSYSYSYLYSYSVGIVLELVLGSSNYIWQVQSKNSPDNRPGCQFPRVKTATPAPVPLLAALPPPPPREDGRKAPVRLLRLWRAP